MSPIKDEEASYQNLKNLLIIYICIHSWDIILCILFQIHKSDDNLTNEIKCGNKDLLSTYILELREETLMYVISNNFGVSFNECISKIKLDTK